MDKRILVAYATKYGSTAEIAEKIGQILGQEGLQVDIQPAKSVKDMRQYSAVVLGSSAYIGSWHKDAVKLLEANEQLLAERKVWLFTSGPTGEGDATVLTKGWVIPAKLQPVVDRIKPRNITLFHGNINLKKLNFIEKWIINNVKTPVGDFRNWDAVSSWARSIAKELK